MPDQNRNPVEDIKMVLGSLAEMAHFFYTSMIKAGADRQEATAGMQSYINAFWMDTMTNARRANQQAEAEEDEQDQ